MAKFIIIAPASIAIKLLKFEGFKITDNLGSINNFNEFMVYMAFGQSLVGSNNIPSTAR